jgi:hypothetical protein
MDTEEILRIGFTAFLAIVIFFVSIANYRKKSRRRSAADGSRLYLRLWGGLRRLGKVTQRAISQIEGNACDTRTNRLIALSRFFNVSIDWLLGRTENREVRR